MIKLLESIEMQTNVPLDKRTVVKTLIERDSISSTVRYLGMKVYVSDEKKEYRLEDGIENTHWKEIKGITNLSEMTQDNNHMVVTKIEKETWNSKADGNHNHNEVYAPKVHTHKSNEITGLPESLKNPNALTIQLNGANDVVYDGSTIKSVNITPGSIGAQPSGNYAQSTHTHAWGEISGKPESFTPASHKHDDIYYTETEVNNLLNGKAPASHTHTATQVSGLPTALKNPNALTISLNGTSQGAYDGSAVKSINITPASIGAQVAGSYAATSHTHDDRYFTESEINSKLSGYQPKGSYAASSHSHSNYLANNTSGTLTGSLTVTGEILSNGNVTAYSDEKVKKNIRAIDNSVIEKLKEIKFYNYEMINDPTQRTRVGVKAQDIEKLFPELVFVNKNGIKSVDYIGLNTYFSFAMQHCLKKLGD